MLLPRAAVGRPGVTATSTSRSARAAAASLSAGVSRGGGRGGGLPLESFQVIIAAN